MTLPTTANVTTPVKKGYRWRINGTYYRDALGMGKGSIEQAISQFVVPTENEAEDVKGGRDQPAKVHAQMDFSSGEGLLYAFAPGNDDWDRKRFWTSEGVHLAIGEDKRGRVESILKWSQVKEITAGSMVPSYSNGLVSYTTDTTVTAGGWRTLAAEGDQLLRISNADGPTNTFSTIDPFNGGVRYPVLSLATDNKQVYVATDGGGIRKGDPGNPTSFASFSTQSADRIWWLKGRLIAARGNTVYEIPSSGTARVILTLASNREANCATDAGAAILVGASDGKIYSFTGDEGNLILAAESPVGHNVTGIASKGGALLLGTWRGGTARLWMGQIGGDLTPKNLQLLREFDTNRGPSHFAVADRSLYFALSPSQESPEAWQLDLSTLGLWRIGRPDGNGGWPAGLGVVGDGQIYMMAQDAPTGGARYTWQPTGTWLDGGYLVTPLIDLSDAREKVWTKMNVYAEGFGGGIYVYYSIQPDAHTDLWSSNWKYLGEAAGDVEYNVNAKGRWITFKFMWQLVGATEPPHIQGYSIEAYPGPGDTRQQLAINASDRVERRGKKPLHVPGFGREIYESLVALEGTSVEVEDLHLGKTWSGTIESVGYPTDSAGLDSPTNVAIVKFRGKVVA